MNLTLDQAMALDAIVRTGTIQKAARELNKGHSAVLYLIRGLEEQIGFALFDRSGYRNRLSAQGEVVLQYCRKLLATRGELEIACQRLKGGWEPRIKLIYDGVVDFNLIADALLSLQKQEIPTEVRIQTAYLAEVEREFIDGSADLMVTILPIRIPDVTSVGLEPIKMVLVAHKSHPLNQVTHKSKVARQELKQHTCIMVRDSAGQLGLSTELAQFKSTILVNDFPTKRNAILRGLGFGWLPEYLIEKDLKVGSLKMLRTKEANESTLQPKLYHRRPELLGKGVKQLIEHFKTSG